MTTVDCAERDVVLDGFKLHYQEWGDPARETLILLHGFGVSGRMFDEFARRASQRYHVLAVDQRGHGDSDWASDGDYRRDAFVADIERFRAALGVERFHLIGHAMGGLHAASYASRYPGRVRSLVLVDSRPETSADGADDMHRFTHADDEMGFDEFVERAHRANPRRSLENIRERMQQRLRPTGDGKWTWKFDRRFRNDRDALRLGSSMTADQEWDLLRGIRAPSLVVRGADSDVLSQEAAEHLAAEMSHARLVVVPDAGHSVPGDNPDDFAAVVLDFLSGVEAGSTTSAVDAGPPIEALVRENAVANRRRPGMGSLLLLAAGAALATVGIGWSVRRRRDRTRREADLRAQQADEAAEVAALQQRLATLAADLAAVGRSGAGRARVLAADPHLHAAIAQVRAVAGETGHRSIQAAHNIDTARLRARGQGAARRSRELAARGARVAVTAARKPAPQRSKWRLWQ